MIARLSRLVPSGALVYLGNSLPVREWDLAAGREPTGWRMAGNRGANGIDGQLSTFLGHCAADRENWAIVGDLTALYDLSAPWLLRGLGSAVIRIVVVNNGGGQIFARLSPHGVLRNEHHLGFAHWARMWNLAYHRWSAVPAQAPGERHAVIELVPDPEATRRFWDLHDQLHTGLAR
jgi:2-succinyl-5-enolpyruvyl-6-hydroxy-3-cyclohexene-1-carboxylate synthase